MARDLIYMQLKKINAAKIKVGGSREGLLWRMLSPCPPRALIPANSAT
jgi:hypothetical protein